MKENIVFKKIYIEITNVCNLNCDFCLKTKRKKHFLSTSEFKHILSQVKPYTDYLYLHVLGEPLIHENINNFIDLAAEDFNVNITSNGFLINNLESKNVRQINISLHSFSEKYNKSFDQYIEDIFTYEEKFSHNTYVNYRLWVKCPYYNEIIKALENHYHVIINEKSKNIKLKDNVFLNFDSQFMWPGSMMDAELNYQGVCYALKDHIAILSNGEVTACCLDGEGVLSFGNIFKTPLKDILFTEKFLNFRKELMQGIRSNELCKHCNFFDRD